MTDCEFCEAPLTAEDPANLALFGHLNTNPDCQEQFDHLLDNIRSSWTLSMSGP